MAAKEIDDEIKALEELGCTVEPCGPRAHCYVTVKCPGGRGCCRPFTINGTPRVPEHEVEKIRRRVRGCPAITPVSGEEEV